MAQQEAQQVTTNSGTAFKSGFFGALGVMTVPVIAAVVLLLLCCCCSIFVYFISAANPSSTSNYPSSLYELD